MRERERVYALNCSVYIECDTVKAFWFYTQPSLLDCFFVADVYYNVILQYMVMKKKLLES